MELITLENGYPIQLNKNRASDIESMKKLVGACQTESDRIKVLNAIENLVSSAMWEQMRDKF